MKNKYVLAILLGILLIIVNMALSMLFTIAFPELQIAYESEPFRAMDDPLMSLFFLYPIALAGALTYIWFKTRKSWKTGLDFGIAFGLLMSVPMFLVNFSSFTFSFVMVASWALFGFIDVLVAGIALKKLEK